MVFVRLWLERSRAALAGGLELYDRISISRNDCLAGDSLGLRLALDCAFGGCLFSLRFNSRSLGADACDEPFEVDAVVLRPTEQIQAARNLRPAVLDLAHRLLRGVGHLGCLDLIQSSFLAQCPQPFADRHVKHD